jgi:Uma2 family endonuclease
MGATKILLTAEEFDNYPFEEDKRYELDEGELIEMTRPAYRHNRVLKNLQFELETFLRRAKLGELLISENLYALAPLTRRAPDVAVILGDRQRELEGAKVIPLIPEIVAEVISPSETTRMILRKLKQYFDAGVKEAWLVYPEAREVEIWTGAADPDHTVTGNGTLESPLLPGFALPLDQLFA